MTGVEKVIEHLGEQLGERVQYVWVCEAGHIGPPGKKRRTSDDPVTPCFECGEPAHLKPTSPSGKKRYPHSLAKFEERDEALAQGALVQLEGLPEDFELSDRQLSELARGARPEIRLSKTATASELLPGHLYEAGPGADIYVLGVVETEAQLVVDYVIHQPEQDIREDSPIFNREATRQGVWVNPQTGEEHRAGPEAEPLTRDESDQLTKGVLDVQLKRQRAQEEQAEALAKELERDYAKHVSWPARKQVERLTAIREATEERIRNLSRNKREKKQ